MDIRIGKQLTQAREALGLVVEDVAHRTKISPSAIRQLESEDFSHFANNVYAKGFLRLYSRFLGIDASPYIAGREGQLIPHEDEVAFLEGIAISTEFQKPEDKPEAEQPAAKAPAAAAARAQSPKVSSGLTTVVLLLVIGIPAAIFLSNLYESGKEAKQGAPARAAAAAPAPAAIPDVPGDIPDAAPPPGDFADIPPPPSGDGIARSPELEQPPTPPETIEVPDAVGSPVRESEIPRAIEVRPPTARPPSAVAAPISVFGE